MKCPRCKVNELNPKMVMNTLSRKDNETYICADCGTAEAIEELMASFTIEEKAEILAENKGWKLMKSFKFPHPDDSYMIITVVQCESAYYEKGFATHIFNEDLGTAGSFELGHYDFEKLEDAIADAKGRL